MTYYILGAAASLVFLGVIFIFIVINGVAKVMEKAHKDGYENPFD